MSERDVAWWTAVDGADGMNEKFRCVPVTFSWCKMHKPVRRRVSEEGSRFSASAFSSRGSSLSAASTLCIAVAMNWTFGPTQNAVPIGT